MKITYLGTAAAEGWPGIFCHCINCEEARALGGRNLRTRAQVLIDDVLLLDFGPDTYFHSMQQNVDLAKVHTLLLTHSHSDHWYPQELILRGEPYAFGLEEYPLTVYGNEKCQRIYRRVLEEENDSATMQSCVKFRQIEPFTVFRIPGYEITSLRAIHDDREDCMIYSICDDAGKRMLYGNDTGLWSEETWEYLAKMHFNLVSLDCTMGVWEGGYGHMSFADNIAVQSRMKELGCADENTVFISTHFSHSCGLEYEKFQEMADKYSVIITYDGMIQEV